MCSPEVDHPAGAARPDGTPGPRRAALQDDGGFLARANRRWRAPTVRTTRRGATCSASACSGGGSCREGGDWGDFLDAEPRNAFSVPATAGRCSGGSHWGVPPQPAGTQPMLCCHRLTSARRYSKRDNKAHDGAPRPGGNSLIHTNADASRDLGVVYFWRAEVDCFWRAPKPTSEPTGIPLLGLVSSR